MTMTRFATIALCGAVLAGSLGLAVPTASAQSCAMCYQNAAAAGPQGRVALQHGILILALPAIALFAGILLLLYSRRNLWRRASLPQDCRAAALREDSFVKKGDLVGAQLPRHREFVAGQT